MIKPDDIKADYLECALWSSIDCSEKGEHLDENYSFSDISLCAMAAVDSDLLLFCEKVNQCSELAEYARDCGQPIGHDFWLTRCGHGAGFWDGDYIEPYAQQLTDICTKMGECELYPGDDGRLYIVGREV